MKVKPITNDEREKIIKDKQNGETEENIAKRLFVSISSVYRILALHRNTGSVLPKPYTGNNRKITKEQGELIEKTIHETPDITLLELIDELELNISESGLSKHLKKKGLTFKKRHSILMDRKEKM